jgi:hypothetical protein
MDSGVEFVAVDNPHGNWRAADQLLDALFFLELQGHLFQRRPP